MPCQDALGYICMWYALRRSSRDFYLRSYFEINLSMSSLIPMLRIAPMSKVGIPNFVSGPREYIMEGEYVILSMCSWFRIR